MKNFKILNKKNLLDNLQHFQSKKICAMVKSNAYGHGFKEIVALLRDKVDCFGVVNFEEGQFVRSLTDKPILICGKTQDFGNCKRYNLEFMIDSLEDLILAQRCEAQDLCHLKINCGMNRFGVKTIAEVKKIDNFLKLHRIQLKSICTHFPCTSDKEQTKNNYRKFLELRRYISQKLPICFGGSNIIDYPFDFDMIRAGIGLYGYEGTDLKPVMSIKSYICKIFQAESGETIGYDGFFKVKKKGVYGVVPVGYGDGLPRAIAEKFDVLINGKSYHAVGKICMDAFFVCIDKSVNAGDEVVVMSNAQTFADKINTISYEILTNFSKIRAETKIEQ